MKININSLNLYCVLAAIIIAAIARILPHPPNVAPITALALFSGAYLDKRWALILPIGAMLLADLFLGLSSITPWIYGSFVLIYLLGRSLTAPSPLRLATITLLSSILFFVLTNLGVWVMFDFYPKSVAGLLECFTAALPFFRNTILGDLAFTGVFFYGYHLISRIFTAVIPHETNVKSN